MAGAPIGNKNACKHDYEQWAESITAWSKRGDAMHLFEWVDENDLPSDAPTDFSQASSLFSVSLKKAKLRIAKRLRDKLQTGEYNYGLFMRELSMYDHYVRDHERAEKKFDADCRKQSENTTSPEMLAAISSFNSQFTAMQHENAELRKQLRELEQKKTPPSES